MFKIGVAASESHADDVMQMIINGKAKKKKKEKKKKKKRKEKKKGTATH